jgi:hypothetical protein
MEQTLIQNAQAYASQHRLSLAERLGFGIHGIILVAEDNVAVSEEAWAEWEAEKREQFEHRWPKVQEILGALEELDIHMVDVSPNNIAFPD